MSTLTDTTPARVIRTIRGRPTSDGAGVKLTRVIGGPDLPDLGMHGTGINRTATTFRRCCRLDF